jgi:hypothetical protein
VAFKIISAQPMIYVRAASDELRKENPVMHDLLIALAFIGIVIAPAVVATRSCPEGNDKRD